MYRSAQRRRRPARNRRPRSNGDSPRRVWVVTLVVVLALAVVGLRRTNILELNQQLVDIREIPDSLVVAGFSLSSARDVQFDISGRTFSRQVMGQGVTLETRLDNVWVINALTREYVWELRESHMARGASAGESLRENVALSEGRYVLYCAATTGEQQAQSGTWVDWLDRDGERVASGDQRADESREFHITVTGKGRRLNESAIAAALETPYESPTLADDRRPADTERTGVRNSDARARSSGEVLVDLTRLEDNEAKFGQFSLSRKTDVQVYAIGEGSDGEMFDFGWIVNTANGRTVWEMKYRDTEHAGGDSKNRVASAALSLRRGNYVVYFVTDESHSYDDWNARAPSYEEGWGITVAEVTGSSDGDIEVRRDNRWAPVAQLVGIRDDVRRRAWITLDRRTSVRIYALGEGDRNEMYDYAWIEDADTRRTVWEMTYRNTERAGGASKNRIFNDTVRLPAGEYVLRYRSDESHSPESWNDEPPDDVRNYGVTVFVERR